MSTEIESIDQIVSGAIFDFAGFLTSRDERITASSTDNAAPMADAVKDFLALRGVDQSCEPFFQWPLRCNAALKVVTQASLLTDVVSDIEHMSEENNMTGDEKKMSNIDDTTTGTGPYLNDDAFDFRNMTETDKKIIDKSCNPPTHSVLIVIEASSMAQIAQAINEVSNRIAGGCNYGAKRDKGLNYTFNKRLI